MGVNTFWFWIWVGGALGQAALTSWHGGVSRDLRSEYHRRGWPILVGRLLGLALWPVLTVVLLIFGRAMLRYLDETQGAKPTPVRCEVCGLEDEIRVVRGRWLQNTPYWYGLLNDGGVSVCSDECAKHWETHHMRGAT